MFQHNRRAEIALHMP